MLRHIAVPRALVVSDRGHLHTLLHKRFSQEPFPFVSILVDVWSVVQ
jgi:hypothetical protein